MYTTDETCQLKTSSADMHLTLHLKVSSSWAVLSDTLKKVDLVSAFSRHKPSKTFRILKRVDIFLN